MASPALELQKLRHQFGNRVALEQVTLTVGGSCVFAFLGPNGGGKTTLFRIISTMLAPAGGTARVLGHDVVLERSSVRSFLGVVFQSPSLDPYLTVAENLMHQGHLYGISGRELTSRSRELLERFGLIDRIRDRVKTLSGGLQRRVELAKCLLHRPSVLILDEPGTGLDPGSRANLMDLLLELRDRDQVTSLLTSHYIDEADRCDRIAILDQGRLIAEGPPDDLRAKIGGDVITIGTRNPAPLAAQITARFGTRTEVFEGKIRMERESAHLFVPQIMDAFPGEVESITIGRPTLADFFRQATGRALSQD